MNLNKSIQEQISEQKKTKPIFIALLLIFCFSLIILMFYIQRNSFTSKLQKYPLLDPTRNLLEKKDAITNFQPLRESLQKLADETASTSRISIYFEFLNTGANIGINNSEKIWPVSLAKLPLALVAMKKIEDGDWRADTMLAVRDDDLNSGSGDLYKSGSGISYSVSDLITQMLNNSDNTAYEVIKRNTSLDERLEMADETGLGDLFADGGKVSAKEYSRLFRSLYTASYLNQENSQKILKILSQNNFNYFLNSGLPNEIMFSHKQGENVKLGVFADSGIVYLENRPYIISVLLEPIGLSGEEGKIQSKKIMQDVSLKVFDYINNK